MLKVIPWDVWAAAVIAVVAVLLVAIFDLSPLLFIVIFFALCFYIVAQYIFDKHRGKQLAFAQPSGWQRSRAG